MNIKTVSRRLSQVQRGVRLIHYSDFLQRFQSYIETYQKTKRQIATNLEEKEDLALNSLCRDKVVEDYLHSGRYTFNRIGVLINPFRYAPKSAVLLMSFKKPCRVEIVLEDNGQGGGYSDCSSLKKHHRISVTGLGNGKNWITLTVYDKDGVKKGSRRIFVSLDKDKEFLENPVVRTEHMNPSTYPHIFITGGDLNPFIFNEDGSLFHYVRFGGYRTSTYGVYPIRRHNFLWPIRNICVPTFANPHSCMFYEMDFMGRISRSYLIRKGMHHYVYEMPNGNIVTVSNSIEGHTEDTLIEIDRKSGRVIREIYFRDLFGEKFIDQVDWVHANALEYNEEENTMLICFRNVHSVIKIDWTTLEVKWLFSLPSLWEDTKLKSKVLEPVGEVFYSFQAHAAYELKDFAKGDNRLRYYIIFDNHRLNRRPIEGYEEDGHSYINIYGVDEENGTVCQVKHLQIDMSIVRSNAVYDQKSDRIFSMAGCLWRDFTEYRGKIEEYDYETEQLLNRWYIKEDFFSAYGFEWKSDDYCEPLDIDEEYEYCCGEADVPVPSEVKGECTEEPLDEIYFSRAYVHGERLYFYTKDHSISSLMLVGEKHCYERDYSGTWQTTDIHREKTYYCAVSLKELENDTYRIKVLCKDKLYDTGYYVEMGD